MAASEDISIKHLKAPAYFYLFLLCILVAMLPERFQVAMAADVRDLNNLPLMLLRSISYMFVHGGWAHLLGNFIFGLAPSLYLERRLGVKRFVAFYILCGMASCLLFCLLQAYSDGNQATLGLGIPQILCGASGAIYGVITYALILFMKEGWWQAVMSCLAFFFLILPQLFEAAANTFDGIAHWGHVGGWIAALFLASFIRPTKRVAVVVKR